MNFSKIGVLFSAMFINATVFAQIQVHEEPLHHPVLKKKNARVLDVIANPGDTSLIHQHSHNYCYVTVSGGRIWVQNANEEGRSVNLPTGYTGGYFENPDRALIHRFGNLSDHLIRLIAVENLSPGNPLDSVYHLRTAEELLINNPYFLVTKIGIPSNEELKIDSPNPTVVVNLEKEHIQLGNKKKTDLTRWKWIDAHKKVIVKNPLSHNAQVVLVQIKNLP